MFENKAKIICMIFSFLLTVYEAAETNKLSPRLPPIPAISTPPVNTETSIVSTPEAPTYETLSTNDMKELCADHNFEAIPYTDNQYKYIVCMPDDPFDRNCPAGQCFDQLSPPCNANACTAPDLTNKFIKEYCTQSDDTFLQRVPDKNCEYFYLCMGKDVEPKHQKCPLNQHYSRMDKKCTSPIEAACMDQLKWCINKPNGLKFPASKCYQYYECSNQIAEFKTCLYYQYFNIEQNKCMQGTCVDDVVRLPICSYNGAYMSHPKCNKYYECSNKIPIERQCPSEYYFNTKQIDCIRDIYNECKI